MSLEKRFVSHYMLIETIRIEENYCRWLAEDMRSNKEVWITEFFEKSENGEGDKWLNLASEIKKISASSIIQIADYFRESDSVFVVTEMPRGDTLKPLKPYNEDRFRKIGEELLRTLILLQRNGIGLDNLSLNDIFVDNSGEIKLLFSENWSLKPENESREKEIALFAIILLNFLGFEDEIKNEISQNFLRVHLPEKIYPLFEEILITRQVFRLESLSRYFQEKITIRADSVLETDAPETSMFKRVIPYVIFGIVVVAIYMMFAPYNDMKGKNSEENAANLKRPSEEETNKKEIVKQEENSSALITPKPASEPSKGQIPLSDSTPKYKEINYNQFHSYWVHAMSGTGPDGIQRYKGAIFGCAQESFNNPVEIVSLDHDVRSIVVDENRNIYWTDITTGEILKADPSGHNIRAIVRGLMYPIALAIDNKNKKLYWNDWQNKLKQQKGYIGRSSLNGEGAEIIVSSGLRSGGTIKIDEREGKIYVADLFGKKIVRINLDGTNMVQIVYSEQPAGLDIDYDHRRIYWSDLSKDGIYASDFDGRNQQRIYTNGDGFSNPEALMYDHRLQRIFFAQNINYQDTIFSIDINGNNLQNVYAQPHLYIHAIVQP